MLAVIEPAGSGYTARYERQWNHTAAEVWDYLTNNDMLKQWFTELYVEELREGGTIRFDMQDGTFERMTITALRMGSVLAYTWGEDLVRFELYPEPNGCKLLLIEQIQRITSHTPRDLAGWHVCLDVIQALLDHRPVESRKKEWEVWHAQYAALIETIQS